MPFSKYKRSLSFLPNNKSDYGICHVRVMVLLKLNGFFFLFLCSSLSVFTSHSTDLGVFASRMTLWSCICYTRGEGGERERGKCEREKFRKVEMSKEQERKQENEQMRGRLWRSSPLRVQTHWGRLLMSSHATPPFSLSVFLINREALRGWAEACSLGPVMGLAKGALYISHSLLHSHTDLTSAKSSGESTHI